ncbi:hypothetical protein ACIBCB_21380 [Streptomyces uncialis]|uniref:hypothetical protein n=1 Tax=Streptomyces uncialis TaxID=1048205 RepID=UPI00379B9EFE
MTFRRTVNPAVMLTAVTAGALSVMAEPAMAGGVGNLLSPAFGVACANENAGARTTGAPSVGTGTATGVLVGLPVGSGLNQCGGADLPAQNLSRLFDRPTAPVFKATGQAVYALPETVLAARYGPAQSG